MYVIVLCFLLQWCLRVCVICWWC